VHRIESEVKEQGSSWIVLLDEFHRLIAE
jgi:hypothetical protein